MIAIEDGAPGTLGALREHGWLASAHCRNRQCWRSLAVDMLTLVKAFGESAPIVEQTFAKVICQKCRGRKLMWRFTRPTPRTGNSHSMPMSGPLQPMPARESEMDRNRRLADASAAESATIPAAVKSEERLPRDYQRRKVYGQRVLVWEPSPGGYEWRFCKVDELDLAARAGNSNVAPPPGG